MRALKRTFSLLELVAQLRRPWPDNVVVHDRVCEQLARLLPQSELAAAWATLEEIEKATGKVGPEALACRSWLPRVELVEPALPQWPVDGTALKLAARLMSSTVICDDAVRVQLVDHLARGPLGPAIWEMREIVWAAATPPVMAEPLLPISAFDQWQAAGELVDQLVAASHSRLGAADDPEYHTSLVVHQLLARQRPVRLKDPRTHLVLARLCATVAPKTMAAAGGDWRNYTGLVAVALASLANAHRIVGETIEARRCLAVAEPYICGEKNLRLRGEYFGLTSATLTHLRQLAEARQASETAIGYFRQLGDRHRMAIELTARSKTDLVAGNLGRETLLRMKRAVGMVDPNRPPEYLREAIQISIAKYYADLGLIEEAERVWNQIGEFRVPLLEYRRQAVMGYIHLGVALLERRIPWSIWVCGHSSAGAQARFGGWRLVPLGSRYFAAGIEGRMIALVLPGFVEVPVVVEVAAGSQCAEA